MKTFLTLVTLLVLLLALLGFTEARLGAHRNDESSIEVHKDAIIDEREQERNLQQGAQPFSNPNAARPFSNPNALDENDNFVRVMVGFKNDNGRRAANGSGKKWMREMTNSRVASMLIPRASFKSLQSNPNIEFVEEDGMMTPDSESVPYGISMTKGDGNNIPAARESSSACSDPKSFKIAIIDSGVEVGHPDIPCLPIDDPNTNCKGISIGIDDLPWYAPKGRAGHGTHVFGTIGAIGGNNEGVTSMVPNSDGICYLIARIFDDEGNGIYASYAFEAIDWAISEGANVINMSLGGGTYYQAGQVATATAYRQGAVTVASAGNSGSEFPQYPASYNNVLGVAAVDIDGTRASFSQYNNKVDVAAPGVAIRSTYIGGRYASLSGTSMAAPHVAGAIAKVWSVCRQCSNAQVESCLLTAASSSSKRTNELGFGIVNAADTYDCLVNTSGCCHEEAESAQEQAEPAQEDKEPELVQEDEQPEPLPLQEVTAVEQCPRRKIGEPCRRDSHCCSGKCAGPSRGMTCQAT